MTRFLSTTLAAAPALALVSSAHGQSPDDTNSITEPPKIVPVSSRATGVSGTFTQTFAPYSINVLQINPH